MREKINRTASIFGYFSLLLLMASLFSVPFPFVRAIWVKELWGLTGLVHAALFMVIGSRIAKVSLPAMLAGMGVILNYEILTALGFLYIFLKQDILFQDTVFFGAALLLGLFLLWILLDTAKSLYRSYLKTLTEEAGGVQDEKQEPDDRRKTYSFALAVSAVAYLAVFGLLGFTLSLEGTTQYGVLKILGVLISPLSFGGIGQEIDYYLQGKQSRFFCIVKSLTHLLALASILWVIYRKLPIASVVIQSS